MGPKEEIDFKKVQTHVFFQLPFPTFPVNERGWFAVHGSYAKDEDQKVIGDPEQNVRFRDTRYRL